MAAIRAATGAGVTGDGKCCRKHRFVPVRDLVREGPSGGAQCEQE